MYVVDVEARNVAREKKERAILTGRRIPVDARSALFRSVLLVLLVEDEDARPMREDARRSVVDDERDVVLCDELFSEIPGEFRNVSLNSMSFVVT